MITAPLPRTSPSGTGRLSMIIPRYYGLTITNWASEASPTLGCSIEISRDIYVYMYIYVGMSRMSN